MGAFGRFTQRHGQRLLGLFLEELGIGRPS